MKTAYDNFHKLFSAYFLKFCNISLKTAYSTYENSLKTTLLYIFSVKIAYESLYINTYHDKHCLSKQNLCISCFYNKIKIKVKLL